ncbi:MAG TPA: alpha/beta hydrolase [Blastocatellia bacterium]|nr:alpha/beta hydrolase [Blastocatellia bacterium]
MSAATLRSAAGAQPPRYTIVLDGVEITYTDSGGTGPCLVCLHAIGHGARDFQDLASRLYPSYRVIALDFPGHGSSGADSHSAGAARYEEIVARFVEKLNLESLTLLGNSIGGAASIRYAAAHPEQVTALVLCNCGGLDPGGLFARVYIAMFVRLFAAGSRGAFWFPWVFARYYRRVLSGEPAREQRDRIIQSAYEIAPILEQAWRGFGKPDADLRTLLPNIHCPVLLAWAKDDFTNQLKRSGLAFDRFPNHRLELFEGGHAAFLEDPDRFEQVLRSFLYSGFMGEAGRLRIDRPKSCYLKFHFG